MKHVPIKEAKDKLLALIREAEAGGRVTITRNGKPVVDLVQHRKAAGLNFDAVDEWKKRRGVDRIVTFISNDFDEALPEDFLITPGPH